MEFLWLWLIGTIVFAVFCFIGWGISKIELIDCAYVYEEEHERLVEKFARLFFLSWLWPWFVVRPLVLIWQDFYGTLDFKSWNWSRKKEEDA